MHRHGRFNASVWDKSRRRREYSHETSHQQFVASNHEKKERFVRTTICSLKFILGVGILFTVLLATLLLRAPSTFGQTEKDYFEFFPLQAVKAKKA